MTTVQLDVAGPGGWLAGDYERAYDRMANAPIGGKPAVAIGRLRSAVDARIPIGEGLTARFTHYPSVVPPGSASSDPDEEPRGSRTLLDVRFGSIASTVVVRRVPYAPRQALLVSRELRPQEADPGLLGAAFALARALGPTYTGTFNVGGRTHDGFHTQLFEGSTPLWRAIDAGAVTVEPAEPIPSAVRRSVVDGWPLCCHLFESRDPAALASAVTAEALRLAAAGRTYDLCYGFRDDEIRVLALPRACATDDEFGSYSPVRRELGKFGSLELSGWVVCIHDDAVFRRLTAEPASLAARYREALGRIETGWGSV